MSRQFSRKTPVIHRQVRGHWPKWLSWFSLVIGLIVVFGISQPVNAADNSLQAFNQAIQAHRTTLIPLISTAILYLLIAIAFRFFYLHSNQEQNPTGKQDPSSKKSPLVWLHPAVITSGEYGQSSISSMQILWFTLIAFYLGVRALLIGKGLPAPSGAVLGLLGVPGGVKLLSAGVSNRRMRLSLDNWSWLIQKGYLKAGNTIDPRGKIKSPFDGWDSLVLTDGTFDPTRYQLLVFSLLIGLSLIMGDDLAKFQVSDSWSVFILGSNAIYIGGKLISPTAVKDLDDRVTAVRTAGKAIDEDLRSLIKQVITSAYGSNALGNALLPAGDRTLKAIEVFKLVTKINGLQAPKDQDFYKDFSQRFKNTADATPTDAATFTDQVLQQQHHDWIETWLVEHPLPPTEPPVV